MTTSSIRAAARKRCTTKAYPVKECAGLLFAYMGPQPAPELPIWEPFTWENGFREVVISDIPCNWFQCQENSCDPVHFEWMHENWNTRLNGETAPYAAKHLKLVFEEFDYGFVYKRVREGQREGDPVWTIGRVTLWPNGFYLGNHFEWRVPIDDENTLSVCWFFMRVPKGREPYVQDKVPTWISPIKDANGRWISSHVINQDIIAWVGQGTIADRTKETLGASDLGIAMMRKRLFDELDAVATRRGAEGDDPQCERRKLHRAAQHHQEDQRRRHHARGARELSAAEGASQGLPPLLRPAGGGAPRVREGDGDWREVVLPRARQSRRAFTPTARALALALSR